MSFVTGFTATLITWIWIILINDYSHQNGHHTASNICHLIKDLLQTLPCECRAFHVPHRPHLVGKAHFDATMIHSHFQQILIVPIYAFINLEFAIFHRCSQPLWQVVHPSPSSPDKPTIINVIGHTWKYTFSKSTSWSIIKWSICFLLAFPPLKQVAPQPPQSLKKV